MKRRFEANESHHSKIAMYLATAESFLTHRSFEECCNYALKAIEIDPNQTVASKIHAIAKVLLISSTTNGEPNHYSILNLPLHTQDQQLIRTNFTKITNLLNSNQNRYPFANEALKHVLGAWSTLSNPTQKARFDDELKGKGKEGSFWTVCPYCYYQYEFFKVYEGCFLRCQNENCKRAFHAHPIKGPPPLPVAVEKGENHCLGFSILGTEDKSSVVRRNDEEHKNEVKVIEISDDEREDGNRGKEESLGVEEKAVENDSGQVNKDSDNDEGCAKMVAEGENIGVEGNERKEESLEIEEKLVETDGGQVNKESDKNDEVGTKIVSDEGTKGENIDAEIHNEKNDGYYMSTEDDINMALQESVDLGFEFHGECVFF